MTNTETKKELTMLNKSECQICSKITVDIISTVDYVICEECADMLDNDPSAIIAEIEEIRRWERN